MNRTVAAAALAAAIGLTIAGCSAAPTPSATWSTDVSYAQLAAGTCLAFSYDSALEKATDSFDTNAYSYHSVDCSAKHLGQVVGVVAVPASSQWDSYGSADGPKHDEALSWLEGVCKSYEVMIAAYSDKAAPSSATILVKPNYGFLGDNELGSCIAYHDDSTPLKGAIDLDKVSGYAAGIADFGATLPDTESNWLNASDTPVSTNWYDLQPATCAQSYSGPNSNTYDAISCDQPHAAEFMIWVDMPSDWDGYQGDTEAQAVVTARCNELQASLPALDDGTAIVVDSSQVGEDQVIDGSHLAQCWAHRADNADLTVDLTSL